MKILVMGATGTVGSQVLRELRQRNVDVRVVTRHPEKVKAAPGIEVVQGDIGEPDTVRSVFKGVDGVFLLTALGKGECHEGLMAACGAREAGVKRVVFMSVHRVDEAAYLPHFGAKIGIEDAVKQTGAAWTILRPNNFHQNDLWFRDVILQHKVYPQPIGNVGLSRVDVRDIAEAAALALTTDGHAGKTYNLVGPGVVTGADCAAIWSKALGTTIAYGGDDLDAWEKAALAMLPAFGAYDFRHMYDFFQKKGLKATEQDVAELTRVLGHQPRSLEAFAEESAKAWTAATKS